MQAPAGYAIKADPALVSIDDTAPDGTMASGKLTLMHGMWIVATGHERYTLTDHTLMSTDMARYGTMITVTAATVHKI